MEVIIFIFIFSDLVLNLRAHSNNKQGLLSSNLFTTLLNLHKARVKGTIGIISIYRLYQGDRIKFANWP